MKSIFEFEYFFITRTILLTWTFFLPPSPCNFPPPGAILHLTIDEKSSLLFSKWKIEQVFAFDSEDVSATSMAVYYNHTLVIGSTYTELTVCEVRYLMYGQDWLIHIQRARMYYKNVIVVLIKGLFKDTVKSFLKYCLLISTLWSSKKMHSRVSSCRWLLTTFIYSYLRHVAFCNW